MDQEDNKKGRLELVAQNRKADANLFNQVMPRGDYVAEVVGSDVIWEAFKATLWLRLICRNKWGVYKTTLQFRIHDMDQAKQKRERDKVGDLGAAMGVFAFDDSDQLHNRPFMLTAWDDQNERFSFRPAPAGREGGQRKGQR